MCVRISRVLLCSPFSPNVLSSSLLAFFFPFPYRFTNDCMLMPIASSIHFCFVSRAALFLIHDAYEEACCLASWCSRSDSCSQTANSLSMFCRYTKMWIPSRQNKWGWYRRRVTRCRFVSRVTLVLILFVLVKHYPFLLHRVVQLSNPCVYSLNGAAGMNDSSACKIRASRLLVHPTIIIMSSWNEKFFFPSYLSRKRRACISFLTQTILLWVLCQAHVFFFPLEQRITDRTNLPLPNVTCTSLDCRLPASFSTLTLPV